mmetsp:Transcript_24961/g.56195  ORF Transcript_24961/g.56195 Transcript_24961/m.56195 type:complete len:204 (-) Transcript_24961:274-885(-)|eukprot:CAMPEP_0172621314 /NCGR_PEP_ID=MMETSP1068-20121228/111123_1 /TAXON_ID=35684 /ORGANISM="Pseudopedinella elastica, Strain CCMP716" /LENGTH=203 /DNA_ID=CAMNT_0013429017 /DNA_START=88 /DNA_END=699 /DNA_ORIENTATION=+
MPGGPPGKVTAESYYGDLVKRTMGSLTNDDDSVVSDLASQYYDQLVEESLDSVVGDTTVDQEECDLGSLQAAPEVSEIVEAVATAGASSDLAVTESKEQVAATEDALAKHAGIDLDKLLAGPIKEVYSTSAPEDAEFMINHMKSSLAGLRPSIESFEEFNEKLQAENRRLAQEEAELHSRLCDLGIYLDYLEPGPTRLALPTT